LKLSKNDLVVRCLCYGFIVKCEVIVNGKDDDRLITIDVVNGGLDIKEKMALMFACNRVGDRICA
jgi:hypothetical protein